MQSRYILLLLPQSFIQGRINSFAVNHEADLTCKEFPHVTDLCLEQECRVYSIVSLIATASFSIS